ncbi:hypothetical protein Trydic_g21202 [Trypoxylus dichotomus]
MHSEDLLPSPASPTCLLFSGNYVLSPIIFMLVFRDRRNTIGAQRENASVNVVNFGDTESGNNEAASSSLEYALVKVLSTCSGSKWDNSTTNYRERFKYGPDIINSVISRVIDTLCGEIGVGPFPPIAFLLNDAPAQVDFAARPPLPMTGVSGPSRYPNPYSIRDWISELGRR